MEDVITWSSTRSCREVAMTFYQGQECDLLTFNPKKEIKHGISRGKLLFPFFFVFCILYILCEQHVVT